MVYVEGYWKIQVVSLIVLVALLVILWNCEESGCIQEANLIPVSAIAYVSEENDAAEILAQFYINLP